MNNPRQPMLVAIVGGSGAGKSWLAEQLQSALGRDAACLSLDNFYRDRSKLSPARRARINFDHPRAIDWQGVADAVSALAAGKGAQIPCYDFKTHCRTQRRRTIDPKAFILMEGLWLLRRPSLRKLFDVGLFIDCPPRTRWRRRLARDLKSRGRSRDSIREQFRRTVEPMHQRFVESQRRWADMIVKSNFSGQDARRLAEQLRAGLFRCNPENTEYETANERSNLARLKRGRTQRNQRQRLARRRAGRDGGRPEGYRDRPVTNRGGGQLRRGSAGGAAQNGHQPGRSATRFAACAARAANSGIDEDEPHLRD